jgi:predicted regulator of Ras-like GTPase activity (Roadblock/LC7/MglB family)
VNWFHEIIQNPHIDVALLVDNAGKLVATTNRVGSEAQRVASMIKAAEVLARGLSAELGRGDMHTLQLSTGTAHVLVIPVGKTHYLIVMINKDAPLELVTVYMQRLVNHVEAEGLASILRELNTSPLDNLDIDELIDDVTNWLHSGGDDAIY